MMMAFTIMHCRTSYIYQLYSFTNNTVKMIGIKYRSKERVNKERSLHEIPVCNVEEVRPVHFEIANFTDTSSLHNNE